MRECVNCGGKAVVFNSDGSARCRADQKEHIALVNSVRAFADAQRKRFAAERKAAGR